jgi:Xaa-Pro aminopeptidase
MWALYNWYSSDFTRTIWVWEKNEEYEEFINYYKIVKQSHEIAFENTQLWMTWKKIDSLARDYIKEKWAWNFFTHWLWHWVWLNIHESPKINQRSTKKIKDNMIFTIEPGIYLEWKFWIRLEDIAFMEEWKLKKYSKVPLKAIF